MSVHLGSGNAAHKMSKLYVGIDGKARQVRKMYVGVDGQARLVYQSGSPIGNLAVGKTVKIAVGGKAYEWIVVHQGIPNASIYDASCAGTWLLMKDIYEERAWHSSNVNDYANSTVHSYLNSMFLSLFEPNIKYAIKQVKIPYRKGSGSSMAITSGSNGLPAKIFLLSATETSFYYMHSTPKNEGAELAYFKGCADNDSDSKRVAYLNGSVAVWWLRTPYCGMYSSDYAFYVSTRGGKNDVVCSDTGGVRPCMILPQDTLVDDTGRVIA